MLTLAVTLAACGISGEAATLLERVVLAESGAAPYALHVNGDVELAWQPRDRDEAVATASWLLARGYSFDAGLTQVNNTNFARLGLTAASSFEPCANLRAGLRILEECGARARERLGEAARGLAATLSCYNTGDFTRGVRSGYVARVLGVRAASRSKGKEVVVGPPEMPASVSESLLAARAPDVFELSTRK